MLKSGNYIAKVVSHATSETKSGAPQAVVTFSLGENQKITWYGSFKEGKAQEITFKSLLAMGLKGNNPAGDLEIGKEVEIVVEIEPDLNGKDHARVKFINPLGHVKNVLSPEMAKATGAMRTG